MRLPSPANIATTTALAAALALGPVAPVLPAHAATVCGIPGGIKCSGTYKAPKQLTMKEMAKNTCPDMNKPCNKGGGIYWQDDARQKKANKAKFPLGGSWQAPKMAASEAGSAPVA
jgi:hypothetical protein